MNKIGLVVCMIGLIIFVIASKKMRAESGSTPCSVEGDRREIDLNIAASLFAGLAVACVLGVLFFVGRIVQ